MPPPFRSRPPTGRDRADSRALMPPTGIAAATQVADGVRMRRHRPSRRPFDVDRRLALDHAAARRHDRRADGAGPIAAGLDRPLPSAPASNGTIDLLTSGSIGEDDGRNRRRRDRLDRPDRRGAERDRRQYAARRCRRNRRGSATCAAMSSVSNAMARCSIGPVSPALPMPTRRGRPATTQEKEHELSGHAGISSQCGKPPEGD